MKRVCVVIPTYRRSASLPSLIATLEAQTLPLDEFEVVIADDASPDDTQDVLRSLIASTKIDLRVVRNPTNGGPSSARNRGWRAARAPVVAFTDDDCRPAPGWLAAGLDQIQRYPVVQGRTLPASDMGGWAKTVKVERPTNLFESCNMFYRTDVLDAVGGFDETITVPFGEDTDLGWKAQRRGFEWTYTPDAIVYHEVSHPGARYWLRYAMMHRNFPLLVRRFPEMRKELLWLRVFLWRDRAVFDAALAGAIGGFFWTPAFALVLPYLYLRRPRSLSVRDLRAVAAQVMLDPAIFVALLVGSARQRTIVL